MRKSNGKQLKFCVRRFLLIQFTVFYVHDRGVIMAYSMACYISKIPFYFMCVMVFDENVDDHNDDI
jgi:hypothetical protein